MQALHICTAAFYLTTEPLRLFLTSAERFGVPIVTYGLGRRFPSYLYVKVDALYEHVCGVSEPYVLYVDGRDSLVTAPARAIEATVEELCQDDIVLGAEKGGCPKQGLRATFSALATSKARRSDYIFPNAGVIAGRTSILREVLREMIAWRDGTVMREYLQRPALKSSLGRLGEDDQTYWQLGIASGGLPVVIDYSHRISISIRKHTPIGDVSVLGGVAYLRSCGSRPCILHFPGSRQRDSVRQWYWEKIVEAPQMGGEVDES